LGNGGGGRHTRGRWSAASDTAARMRDIKERGLDALKAPHLVPRLADPNLVTKGSVGIVRAYLDLPWFRCNCSSCLSSADSNAEQHEVR
jgi:hypothetical protein